MPQPLSATRTRHICGHKEMTMRVAPASREFSTNSLTTATKESMTSPAVIRYTTSLGKA